MSYQKNQRTKKFRYNEDRDQLQRALDTMVTLLRWQGWLLLVIAMVLLAIFLRDTMAILLPW